MREGGVWPGRRIGLFIRQAYTIIRLTTGPRTEKEGGHGKQPPSSSWRLPDYPIARFRNHQLNRVTNWITRLPFSCSAVTRKLSAFVALAIVGNPTGTKFG
jgi:hypothetical protein